MENPYVREGLIGANRAGGHSPNRIALATRNSGKMMNLLTASRPATAVDKAVTRPYLCAVGSVAEALILLAFLAVEPGIAYFPLIRRHGAPGGHPRRHGELIQAIWQMDLGL
jgi:hypothetical protein